MHTKQFRCKLFKELVVQVRSYSFEKSLLGEIGQLAAQVERQLETVLKVRYNLTFSQFRVMSVIYELGETSQRPIVDELGLSAALITRQLDALVSRGVVTQKQNPESRRENVVSLTAKGSNSVDLINKTIKTIQAEILDKLDLEAEANLSRALKALIG